MAYRLKIFFEWLRYRYWDFLRLRFKLFDLAKWSRRWVYSKFQNSIIQLNSRNDLACLMLLKDRRGHPLLDIAFEGGTGMVYYFMDRKVIWPKKPGEKCSPD